MRKGIWQLAALLLCMALQPVTDAATARADTVKIAHSTWVGYGPLYIARDKGILRRTEWMST